MATVITREGYKGLVEDYQAGNGQAFNELLDYLKEPINRMTAHQYARVKGYGHTFGDVYSIALEVLWEATEHYDGSQGADFLAYFKQRLQWKVNDVLLSRKAFDTALSQDINAEGTEEGLHIVPDALIASDNPMLNVDYSETYKVLLDRYLEEGKQETRLVQEARKKDAEFIAVVMQAVEQNIVSSHDLNDYLYSHYEGVNKNSVRRQKANAFKRFGEFLQENI